MSGALGRIACVAMSRVMQHWAIVGYIDEILLCLHIVFGIVYSALFAGDR